jgi:hypothetical protein
MGLAPPIVNVEKETFNNAANGTLTREDLSAIETRLTALNQRVTTIRANKANKINVAQLRSEVNRLIKNKANKGNIENLGKRINERGFIETVGASAGKVSTYASNSAAAAAQKARKARNAAQIRAGEIGIYLGEQGSAYKKAVGEGLTATRNAARNTAAAAAQKARNARNATIRGVRGAGHTLVPLTTFGGNANLLALTRTSRSLKGKSIGQLRKNNRVSYNQMLDNHVQSKYAGFNNTNKNRIKARINAALLENAGKTGMIFGRSRFH